MQETINDDRTGGGKDMILAERYHILRQLGQGGMGAVWRNSGMIQLEAI